MVRTKAPVRFSVVMTLCVLGASCATSRGGSPPPPKDPPPETVVKLEPIKVVGKTDTPDALSVYDAATLFQRGSEFLDGRYYADARTYFQKLLDEFPDSSYVHATHYNLGVALLETGEPQSALPHFDKYLENATEPRDRLDASFKRGACQAMLGRYDDVIVTFDALLEGDLDTEDRIEALVDSGIGYFMKNDRGTAELRFSDAVKLHKSAEKNARLDNDYHFAQALFYLGEVERLEYQDYKLTLPENGNIEDHISKQLEEKCQRLLRAQYAFLKVIRTGHVGWASAAGYKVGTLYEELHDQMVNLPIPKELTQDQAEMYKREVRKKVAILIRKAIKVYESTVNMARRTGAENVWVTRTEESLRRMQELIREAETMEAEDKAAS